MLYVFQVDTGIMMTFGIELAMETVRNLKKAISAKTQLHEDKQVLLVSGGESLDDSHRVCSYSSAGTDTSPIYLFAKVNIESSQPPQISEEYGNDYMDMTERIQSCIAMASGLSTLVARTELAADLNQTDITSKEDCERLVHDQHLQQQGWAAVTANLDDLTRAFQSKAEMLLAAFKEFIRVKPEREELLRTFKNDLNILDNIPILPILIDSCRFISPSNQSSNNSNEFSSPQSSASSSAPAQSQPSPQQQPQHQEQTAPPRSDPPVTTLLQWIDLHDSQNNLENVAEFCQKGLERFNEANANQIRVEVQELIKQASNSDMKAIKGLEERLFGLEKLMVDARKVVEEQKQLATGFQCNRDRFSKVKDSSLLPDLSESHKRQLVMMLTNHQKISDYRDRCIKAKHELSFNLHNRLKWIMYVEQGISDFDGKLMIYKENLLRLNRHFEIINQVHKAPVLYLEAVSESLRRRKFSRAYLHWATSIVKKSQQFYEDEMEKRKAFDKKIGSHFLTSLFPGLTRSYPPPFATIQPDPFDTKLPRITAADIYYLQSNICSELADNLTIPKNVPMPHLIMTSQRGDNADDTKSSESEGEDLDDRHSLNPTPPSSPQNTKAQSEDEEKQEEVKVIV